MIATALVMGRRVLLALTATALTSGCNLIVDADRKQCAKDDDCTKRGPAFQGTVCVNSMCEPAAAPPDPLWGCLDGPPPEPVPPGPVTVRIHAQNILDQSPISGATVTLCRKIDPSCEKPHLPPVVTDDNGDAVFQAPAALPAAYVSIIKEQDLPPEEAGKAIVPAYYYFNPTVNTDLSVSVQMATVTLRNQLTFLIMAPQEDTRGLLLINALNCNLTAAAGIVYKADVADENTKTFYVVEGIPNTSINATNVDGFGGFVNIPSGTVAVTGEIETTGRPIDTVSFHVRPNAITYSRLVPSGQPPSPQ